MRESLRRIIPLAAFILIFSCLPATSAAQEDQEVRQAILQLAQGNVQTALDTLADSGDSRVIQFVKAYIEGSVYLWRGRPVVCREIVGDADNRRVGALHDALTGSPVKDADGQPAVVPEEDLKEVSPSRRERNAGSPNHRHADASRGSGLARRPTARVRGLIEAARVTSRHVPGVRRVWDAGSPTLLFGKAISRCSYRSVPLRHG